MKYYMAVTPDEYELPLYVAESAKELGKVLGMKEASVYSIISHNRPGKISKHKIIKIEVEE